MYYYTSIDLLNADTEVALKKMGDIGPFKVQV